MLGRRRPLVRGVARTAVVAGTATAVAGGVRRRQNNRWAEKDQAQYEQQMAQQQAAAPPPPAAAPAAAGDVAELQQLADLHAQGILTDEEFAAKKAQILGI
jgi:hypothetical protein